MNKPKKKEPSELVFSNIDTQKNPIRDIYRILNVFEYDEDPEKSLYDWTE